MEIIIQTLSCSRCGHQWVPRIITKQCPRCKTFNWNQDKDYDRRRKEYSSRSYERRKRSEMEKIIRNIKQKKDNQIKSGETKQ